jgi:DNA topoisomerase-3
VPIEDPATLKTPCPKCGGVVTETYRRFACTSPSCDFSIGKHPGSRTLEVDEVEQLLRDRTIGPLQGFISKMGRPFAAVLKITPEFKLEFDFGQANADEGSEAPVDFSGQSPMGACPKCAARVFEQPMAYVCEKSVGPDRSCDFRSGKVILQQPIERAQMEKLLAGGRTDVLRGFVSNRTRRKFSAFLVKKPDGSIGFEFEPREARAGKKPARSAKAALPAKSGDRQDSAPADAAAAPGPRGAARAALAGTRAAPGTAARKAATRSAAKGAKTVAKAPAKRATKAAAAPKPAKPAKSAKTGTAVRKAPARG